MMNGTPAGHQILVEAYEQMRREESTGEDKERLKRRTVTVDAKIWQ